MVQVRRIIPEWGVNYRGALLAEHRHHENAFVEECRGYEVHDRAKYVIAPPKVSSELAGVQRLRRFEELLENGFLFKRHIFQRQFHDRCVQAMAEAIVGDDWKTVGPEIMSQRGWKKLVKMVLGKAPRRFGKSQAVGRLAIAFAICKPGSTQAIFSTGRRASKNLLDIAYKHLTEAGYGHLLERYNQEELWFWPEGKPQYPGDEKPLSKIYSYPAKATIDAHRKKREDPSNPPPPPEEKRAEFFPPHILL